MRNSTFSKEWKEELICAQRQEVGLKFWVSNCTRLMSREMTQMISESHLSIYKKLHLSLVSPSSWGTSLHKRLRTRSSSFSRAIKQIWSSVMELLMWQDSTKSISTCKRNSCKLLWSSHKECWEKEGPLWQNSSKEPISHTWMWWWSNFSRMFMSSSHKVLAPVALKLSLSDWTLCQARSSRMFFPPLWWVWKRTRKVKSKNSQRKKMRQISSLSEKFQNTCNQCRV